MERLSGCGCGRLRQAAARWEGASQVAEVGAGPVDPARARADKVVMRLSDFDFDLPDEGAGANPAVLDGLVMGERLTVDGRTYAPHHVFRPEDIFGAGQSRYEDTNLEQLDQFLKILNYLGVKYGGLDPSEVIQLSAQDRLSIRNNVRSEYAAQAAAEPVYETLEGWAGSTRGARRWADLPAQAIKYVKRVEELVGAPVAMLSTSPERDDTVVVSDPYAG